MRLRYVYGNEPMSREPTREHGSYFDLQRFSADGTLNFDTKVDTDGLEEGTDEVGAKASKLGSIFETGLGVLAGNLMTEAVGKIKELGAEVVNAGADYEQLVGGVQKLYGNMGQSLEEYAAAQGKSTAEVKDDWQALEDAQNLALKNAQNAYKTSGMSMNEYMETATSFSASLINALGGDTVKAAEQTDIAMQAISDNVNTFGSDAEAVKNAFMGFSKENYSMLDNLKLGYGGTKTEMERLIADANEWGAANGEASNLSIDSFSDVVTAIQQIQEKQNIAGTTAREAASTYSGSLAMLQSAWTNVLTAIGSGENMDAAVAGLGESLVAYGGNAIKMAMTIVEQIPVLFMAIFNTVGAMVSENLPNVFATIETALYSLMDKATLVLTEYLPNVMQKGAEWVQSLVSGMTGNMPSLVGTVMELINSVLYDFTSALPSMLQSGVSMISSIVQGILTMLPTMIKAAGGILDTFLNYILESLPTVWESGVQLLTNIVNGIIDHLPDIVAAMVKVITSILLTIVQHLPEILLKGVAIIIKLVAGLIQAIPKIIAAMPQIIKAITSALAEFNWGNVGKNIIDGIVKGVKSVASALRDAIVDIAKGALNAVKKFFGIASPSKVMAKQVGRFLPLGIASGIEQTTDDAVAQMEESARAITDAATGTTASGIISGARAATQSATGRLNEGISERSATITVPLFIDGREFARAEAPYLNKQLAWEA